MRCWDQSQAVLFSVPQPARQLVLAATFKLMAQEVFLTSVAARLLQLSRIFIPVVFLSC